MSTGTHDTQHNAQPWQVLFLAVLMATRNVRAASRAAGISHTHAYNERGRNLAFAGAWDAVRATPMGGRSRTSPWQHSFLAALAEKGNVSLAVRASGTSRANAYATRRRQPVFAAAWARVLAEFYARQVRHE